VPANRVVSGVVVLTLTECADLAPWLRVSSELPPGAAVTADAIRDGAAACPGSAVLITPAQAAEIIGTSPERVRRQCRARKWPGVQVAGHWYMPRDRAYAIKDALDYGHEYVPAGQDVYC
jgi:hypothetical protein